VTIPAILAPVFVQVALTFVLLICTGRVRFAAVRAGEVQIGNIALGQRAWPTRVQQVSNAFQNEFELPVLFYVLVALALFTRKADLLFVVMAWVFVLSRLAHAYVYATSDIVMLRFQIFLVGAMVLMLMWAIFAGRSLFGAL
jgi:hypothetical protein